MADIISISGLTKQYDPPKGPMAVNGVDLRIREAEIVSLLGPNGAGKTTLIALICGLFPPSGGDVLVGGHSVVREPMEVKRITGVVLEEIALYPQLSGVRNLRYFGQLFGLFGQSLNRAIEEVLELTGLTSRANDRVGTYSSGMKRRLNVSVGLLHNPRVVLLDEPTLGLDPESRRAILDLVLRLKRDEGTTILYATHHMDEAQELSDRVAIIHQGRIIALGSPDELIRMTPADDTLRLNVGQMPMPSAVLGAMRRTLGVTSVAREGSTIVVSLRDTANVLPKILRITAESEVVVSSLSGSSNPIWSLSSSA